MLHHEATQRCHVLFSVKSVDKDTFPGRYALLTAMQLSMFRWIFVPPFSGLSNRASVLPSFDTEVENIKFTETSVTIKYIRRRNVPQHLNFKLCSSLQEELLLKYQLEIQVL